MVIKWNEMFKVFILLLIFCSNLSAQNSRIKRVPYDSMSRDTFHFDSKGYYFGESFYLDDIVRFRRVFYQNNCLTAEFLFDKSGREHGKSTIWDTSGNIVLVQHHRHGELHGKILGYYLNNRKKMHGKFKNGAGTIKTYYPTGQLEKIEKIIDSDFLIWKEEYCKNGQLRYSINFSVVEFEYKEYHCNGNLKVEGKLKNGQKEGLWVYYNNSGKKIREESYDEGLIIHFTTWD